MTIAAYYLIGHYKINNSDAVEKISSYGMGIYLYAEPLNYLLLYLFYTWFGIEVFGNELGAAALWFLRVALTSAIAVLITRLLKRANLKYLY